MTRERMVALIHNAGFNTQKELAEYFGISPVTIQGWGYKNAIPYWLESWLVNKIKADAFEEMVAQGRGVEERVGVRIDT